MIWRTAAVLGVLLLVAGVSAGLVFAQLSDTQTASGTVNATSTSADLYICEPNATPGPACGSDDSGADEIVFETLEDISPGETVFWDVRLVNVGTVDWAVSANTTVTVGESSDPGADCPNGVLGSGRNPSNQGTTAGIFILGKSGDAVNDNLPESPGFSNYRGWSDTNVALNIKVAAGDYEDVRLALQLTGAGVENCDGNEWNVSWAFAVN